MRLDFLRPLYEGTGDYASVYLDASRTSEDAAELVAPRWRAAREHLADGGADQVTLGALEELVTGQEHSVPGLAAFARGGEVALTTALAAAAPAGDQQVRATAARHAAACPAPAAGPAVARAGGPVRRRNCRGTPGTTQVRTDSET